MTPPLHDALGTQGVLPVVTIDDLGDVCELADALINGGVNVMEITLRTPVGLDAIGRLRDRTPSLVIGAGSVMSAVDVDRAVDVGAQFIVSPGYDADVVSASQEHAVDVIPGVATATEMQAATNAGIDVVKIFPAELAGGVRLIDAFSSVWPQARFVPTGGITADSAPSYLQRRSVLAVGGSWMVPPQHVVSRSWEQITTLTQQAMAIGCDRS